MKMIEEGNNQPVITPKRIKVEEITEEEEEDRISVLPDALLLEILYHLASTKSAIRTGTLSKRWKYLWTSVPALIFQHIFYNQRHSSDFVSFVNKTLTQYRQPKLRKFTVHTRYSLQIESHVNNWIRYAISCKVEELDLTFWNLKLWATFVLNECFFNNSCFTDLTLQGCRFNPVGAISWKRLRNLYIGGGSIDEDLIENILSGSPLLESLTLRDCYGYRKLDITSNSVKNLELSGYMDPDNEFGNEDIIEINAPSILSLSLQDDLLLGKLCLLNVSSLLKANLNYRKHLYYHEEAEVEMLKGFIQSLCHVKELKIGFFCRWVMDDLKATGFIFPSNVMMEPTKRYLID